MSGICIVGAWVNYAFGGLFLALDDEVAVQRALLTAIFCTLLAIYYQRKELAR